MREIKKIRDPGFDDPEYAIIVANVKRVLEKWSLDADFRKAYAEDPERAVADTGLGVDPETVRLLTDPEAAQKLTDDAKAGVLTVEDLPEDYVLYKNFIAEKHSDRNRIKYKYCVPDKPDLQAWRARQERRCRMEFGKNSISMVQPPLMFELTEGCSVGCPFCGFAAKKLRGIFRYTEENGAMWRGILERMHRLIGDAAGRGVCYCASEGLDNPDYERFIHDFYGEFGVVPQTTTAASTRNIERTRALLQYSRDRDRHIDRFSVLSAGMRDKIFESFTPEELLLVELLPQFPEAPSCRLSKTGRNWNREGGEDADGTIACASGFVVNMSEMSVRLVTPFVTDNTHPTGEWTVDKRRFTDAEDLETVVRQLIEEYMPPRLELSAPCGIVCDFRMEKKDGKVWVYGHAVGAPMLASSLSGETLDRMTLLLKKRSLTGYEIMNDLLDDESVDGAQAIFLLRTLWKNGLVDSAVCGAKSNM